jgi:diguanylate cyclase (GGDEF)-like protein/PAS domain S-box-containing protein
VNVARTLTAGFISDSGRLAAAVPLLAARGVSLSARKVRIEDPATPGSVDLLLVDDAALDVSPQHLSQRIRIWGMTPYVVMGPRLDLARARIWHALGAIDYVAEGDADRLALLLEQLTRRHNAASSDLLQKVIDAVPAPIFFKDEHGVYLGCNRAFEGFIGVSPQDIVGKTVYDVAPKHLADVYHKADADLMNAGGQQVYEAQVKFKDGSLREVVFHKAVFARGDGSKGGLVGAMLDITERKVLEGQLERLATLDPLTGIYNRRTFMSLATRDLSRCRREQQQLSLLVLDLDHFKQVNDTYGHAAGDAVLLHLANLMHAEVRQHDIIARAGGEEFFVSLGNTGLAAAELLAQRLCRSLAAGPVEHDGRRIEVTASIGVADCDPRRDTIETALQRADAALYEAKRRGRNRVVTHS